MARTLSRIAEYKRFFVLAAACGLPGVGNALAEPTTLQNPYVQSKNKTVPVARPASVDHDHPEPPLQNPFAGDSMPAIELVPFRRGSISRWHRVVDLPDSAKMEPLSLQQPAGMLSSVRLLGDGKDASVGGEDLEMGDPPDPILFAPRGIVQPSWLTPEVSSPTEPEPEPLADLPRDPEPLPPIDPFEEPYTGLVIISDGATKVSDEGADSNTPLDVLAETPAETPEACLAHAERLAQQAQSLGQLSRVLRHCRLGLEFLPSEELDRSLRQLAAWAENRRGELHSEAGRQQAALSHFQAALRADPNCWLSLHNRAITLAQQQRPMAALRDFGRTITLNPGLTLAYRNRGELLASLGRMEEAIADYDQAIEQLPKDPALYQRRGQAWHRLGKYERALQDLDRSIELGPHRPDAYTSRGNFYAELGDYEQAIGDIQLALQIDPLAAEAYRSVAWLMATCPDPSYRDAKQALTAAERAVELGSKHDAPAFKAVALETLAAAQANAEQYDAAVQTQQQAMAKISADRLGSSNRRLALYETRQPYRSGTPSKVRVVSHEE